MRFTRRPRCEYIVTDRKRAAAARSQRRQRDALPLLAPLIAEAQPGIDEVMATRVVQWIAWEQRDQDRRAADWRKARAALDRHAPATRRTLLDYWNGHRWLPGDPMYLLDLLHGFSKGRLLIEDGQIRPAAVTIPVSEAVAAFGPSKPAAAGWFGKRVPGPPRKPPHASGPESLMRSFPEGRKP